MKKAIIVSRDAVSKVLKMIEKRFNGHKGECSIPLEAIGDELELDAMKKADKKTLENVLSFLEKASSASDLPFILRQQEESVEVLAEKDDFGDFYPVLSEILSTRVENYKIEPLSDTEIHRNELLITMDYLLSQTDEEHPGSVADILKYAKKYGLAYNPAFEAGNDIKRQRIYDVLKYLKRTSDNHPESFPFGIEQNEHGKYYVDLRLGLYKEEVPLLIQAIKSSKYAEKVDLSNALDSLLAYLLSSYQREELDKDDSKYDLKTPIYYSRSFKIVSKAYYEGKLIRCKDNVLNNSLNKSPEETYYRVADIREFGGVPYAVLLEAKEGGQYRVKRISDIRFPAGALDRIVIDEMKKDRRLKPQKGPDSVASLINQQKFPIDDKAAIDITFSFQADRAERIAERYLAFFSERLSYQRFDLFEYQRWKAKPETGKPKECPDGAMCVSRIQANPSAFLAWLMSSYTLKDTRPICAVVNVISPKGMKAELAKRYLQLANRLSRED